MSLLRLVDLGVGVGTVSQGLIQSSCEWCHFPSPSPQNIEIRSSVQQRPIFTIIYHSCPCTQGLITPYMVNKPLTCSRQYGEPPYSSDESTCAGHISIKKNKDDLMCVGLYRYFCVQSPLFLHSATPHRCWKLSGVNKQRPRPSLTG